MKYTIKEIKQLNRLGQRAVFGQELLECAKSIDNIIAMSGDLGNSSGLDRFKRSIPERFYNVGIAEQNMVGFAAGFSKHGFNVFATSFAPFITMRSCEQVRLNLGYMKENVKIVSIGSGISMGYLGNSHFGLEDISIIRSIPNIDIICPTDPVETAQAVRYLANHEGPVYLRLTGVAGQEGVSTVTSEYVYGKASCVHEGNDALMISYGSILNECLKACKECKSHTALI